MLDEQQILSQLDNNSQNIAKLRGDIARIITTTTELQRSAFNFSDQTNLKFIKRVQKTVDNLRVKMNKSDNESREIQENISLISENISELGGVSEKVTNALATLTESLEVVQEYIRQIREKLKDIVVSLYTNRKDIANIKIEIAEIHSDIDDMKADAADFKAVVREELDDIRGTVTEIIAVTFRIEAKVDKLINGTIPDIYRIIYTRIYLVLGLLMLVLTIVLFVLVKKVV